MKTKKLRLAAVICTGIFLHGCATEGQSLGAAALGCGALGAGIGVLTGSAGWGALAGGSCMGLAAVAVHEYHSSQVRTVQQDQQLYGYATPVSGSGTEVKIRDASANPKTAHAGDTVKLALDYSVIAPANTQSVNVDESMVLKKDGKVEKELSKRSVPRTLGGGASEVTITIPQGMPAGTYVIENRVQTGNSYDVRDAVLVVS